MLRIAAALVAGPWLLASLVPVALAGDGQGPSACSAVFRSVPCFP